jgi:hypothetical protein
MVLKQIHKGLTLWAGSVDFTDSIAALKLSLTQYFNRYAGLIHFSLVVTVIKLGA